MEQGERNIWIDLQTSSMSTRNYGCLTKFWRRAMCAQISHLPDVCAKRPLYGARQGQSLRPKVVNLGFDKLSRPWLSKNYVEAGYGGHWPVKVKTGWGLRARRPHGYCTPYGYTGLYRARRTHTIIGLFWEFRNKDNASTFFRFLSKVRVKIFTNNCLCLFL